MDVTSILQKKKLRFREVTQAALPQVCAHSLALLQSSCILLWPPATERTGFVSKVPPYPFSNCPQPSPAQLSTAQPCRIPARGLALLKSGDILGIHPMRQSQWPQRERDPEGQGGCGFFPQPGSFSTLPQPFPRLLTPSMEHGCQDGGEPRGLTVAGLELMLQFSEEDASACGEAQSETLGHQGGQEHHPGPAALCTLRDPGHPLPQMPLPLPGPPVEGTKWSCQPQFTCHFPWVAETIPSSCPSTSWEVARGKHVGLGISFHPLPRASLAGGASR